MWAPTLRIRDRQGRSNRAVGRPRRRQAGLLAEDGLRASRRECQRQAEDAIPLQRPRPPGASSERKANARCQSGGGASPWCRVRRRWLSSDRPHQTSGRITPAYRDHGRRPQTFSEGAPKMRSVSSSIPIQSPAPTISASTGWPSGDGCSDEAAMALSLFRRANHLSKAQSQTSIKPAGTNRACRNARRFRRGRRE